MYEYMTRHMIALREMPYAGQDLKPGDPFVATPVDADYLTRHKRAKEVEVSVTVSVESPVIVEPVPVETVPVEPAGTSEQAPDEAPEFVVAEEPEMIAEPEVRTVRRGRPRRNP